MKYSLIISVFFLAVIGFVNLVGFNGSRDIASIGEDCHSTLKMLLDPRSNYTSRITELKSSLSHLNESESNALFKSLDHYQKYQDDELLKQTLKTVLGKEDLPEVASTDSAVTGFLGRLRNTFSRRPSSSSSSEQIEAIQELLNSSRQRITFNELENIDKQIFGSSQSIAKPHTLDSNISIDTSIDLFKYETTPEGTKVSVKSINDLKNDSSVTDYLRESSEAYSNLSRAQSLTSSEELKRQNEVFKEAINVKLQRIQQIGNEIRGPADVDKLIEISTQMASVAKLISYSNIFGENTDLIIKEVIYTHLLKSVNVAPARVLKSNQVFTQTTQELSETILEGIVSSYKLVDDIITRTQLGLSYSTSPEWISPSLLKAFQAELKKQGSQVVVEEHKVIEVDQRQFMLWLKMKMQKNQQFANQVNSATNFDMKKTVSEFKKWMYAKQKYYHHKKEGELLVDLNFVDDDFIKFFGKYTAKDKERFSIKRKLWYEDEVVWRGMSFTDRTVSEDEVITLFKNMHHMIVSNKSLGSWSRSGVSHERGIEIVKREFKNYNESLYTGDLSALATDHQTEGPRYWSSYGLSTSRDYKVGRAFAAGAMKIAQYGSQYDEALQQQLKSRILVGARRGKKDVELNKLRVVEPEFRSTYPRQNEVMAIGGLDPESIDAVHVLGPDRGMAEFSYIRNPKNPNIIEKYEGLVNPDDNLDELEVVSSFNLDEVAQ